MELNEKQAKKILEQLGKLQERFVDDIPFPCPRCGRDNMERMPVKNALSRRAKVYICSECGMDEALRDFTGYEPLSFLEWGMIKAFADDKE